jgi:hypothetical protein
MARVHTEKMKRRAVYLKLCIVYMQKNAYFLISFAKPSSMHQLGAAHQLAAPWRTSLVRLDSPRSA